VDRSRGSWARFRYSTSGGPTAKAHPEGQVFLARGIRYSFKNASPQRSQSRDRRKAQSGASQACLSVPDVVEAPTSPAYVANDEDLAPAFFEEPASSPTQEELDAELTDLEELCAILGVK
jgi:hypothetical protein